MDDQFNCSIGCESANQCEYYNSAPAGPALPQLQGYVDQGGFGYGGGMFDDGVVPSNHYEATRPHMQSYQNYSNQPPMQPNSAFYNQSANHGGFPNAGNYFTDNIQLYPPCQGPRPSHEFPTNYAQCYGYYGEAPCQFANVVDMEDFM